MKDLYLKILGNLKSYLSLKYIIPYSAIILLVILTLFFRSKSIDSEAKLSSEVKLRIALTDSITTYENERKELVSEKKTLQLDKKDLTKMNDQLTKSQKELSKRIDEISKDKILIAAALIKSQVKIDSLMKSDEVIVNDSAKTVEFKKDTTDIKYELLATNVRVVDPTFKPKLVFNKFILPNTQFITFNWNKDRKEGFPVSFNVSNSNPYFETVNIDSYIIPEIDKVTLKPNIFNKLGITFKNSGKAVVFIGIGAAGALLLLK